VYDTFILQFFEPFTVENELGTPKQQHQEYQMELLNEERPTQSLYVMDKLECQSDFTKNKSKHILKREGSNKGLFNNRRPNQASNENQNFG